MYNCLTWVRLFHDTVGKYSHKSRFKNLLLFLFIFSKKTTVYFRDFFWKKGLYIFERIFRFRGASRVTESVDLQSCFATFPPKLWLSQRQKFACGRRSLPANATLSFSQSVLISRVDISPSFSLRIRGKGMDSLSIVCCNCTRQGKTLCLHVRQSDSAGAPR